MSNIIPETILEDLYQSRSMSIRQIAEELKISEFTVRQSLIKYEIPRRSIREAAYAKHNKTFSIKPLLTKDDQVLYGLGMGLYWGEGNKADPNSVRLGNTDPGLLVTFVKFLRVICGIPESDIKFGLQVFNDSDPEAALLYWHSILQTDSKSFHATVSSIAPQGKGNYKKKSKYGVLQIYVCNKRFKEWIMKEIQILPK